jgi:NADH-ubiquinone oxidoreductase chain 5
MEAPVPASALIHSATLVSAGIFLLLKFQTLFIYCDLLPVIFFIGSITACYGGVVASAQSDMKKLLAYSTISHCGFLFASIALNNFVITIVYLYLHGLFKALTFFCAGSVIKYNGTQDMRLMGASSHQVFDSICLITAGINLGGLPFTFGYLYKYLFLNYLIINSFNLLSYGFLIIGMLCSIIYIFKLIYYSCFDFRKGFLDISTLLLQNNKNNTKNYLNTFSYAKTIAFFCIYLFAILFYIIVKLFILKNYLFFYYTPETHVNNYNFLSNIISANSYLIKIYYSLYVIVIYTLFL